MEYWNCICFHKNGLHHFYDRLGQLKTIYLLEKYVRAKFPIIVYLGEASANDQLLGKDAQDKVGVPVEYQVPIRKTCCEENVGIGIHIYYILIYNHCGYIFTHSFFVCKMTIYFIHY